MTPGDRHSGPYEQGPRGQHLTSTSYAPIVVARHGSPVPANWLGEPVAVDDERGFNIRDYWQLVLKHRVVVLGALIASLAVGLAITLLTTPIYTASTTLQIDREAAKVVDMEGVTPAEMMSGEEFFQTQYGLLKSTSLATRVVDDLALGSEGFLKTMGEDARGGDKAAQAELRKKASELVSENLRVRPVRGSRLVEVTFDSPSPQLSARVANGVADSFIESNLERRYESASYARDFLEQRLKQVKARLEESEKQLVAYAAAQQIINVNTSPMGQTGGAEQTASQSLTATDLVGMNTALATAKAERIRAEERWRQAQRSNASSLPEVLQSPTIQALRQQKASLSAQYQDKLSLYKPDFPVMVQLKAQIDELDRQIGGETETIRRSLQSQYQVAAQQEASLGRQVASLKSGVMDIRNRSIQYNILQREVDTNRTLYDGLLQRYKEIGIAGGVGSNNVSVVDRATPPGSPSRPDPLLNMAVAAVLGLLAGLLAALLLEVLDESIESPADVEGKLGLTLLGAIPLPPKGASVEHILQDPRSALSEAYYSVRTALQFSTPTGAPDVLLVTSSAAAEGKSTTSRVIADNFARVGMRALLIDSDLRNPSLHRALSADNSKGLSNVLTGRERLADVVQTRPQPGLFFVSSGPLPPNPAELLASSRLAELIAEARSEYDIVILDGPPVLGLADAPILAHIASGVLLVVASGGAKRFQARSAMTRLAAGGESKIIGALLTKYNARRAADSYGYSYGYDYGEPRKITAQF